MLLAFVNKNYMNSKNDQAHDRDVFYKQSILIYETFKYVVSGLIIESHKNHAY